MTISKLWSEVLKTLQFQMTKATFETWLKNTTAQEEEDGRLIVSTPSSFAQDWLDNRLRDTIERAVAHVAGRPLQVEFCVPENGGYQPELFFTGTYRDAYNAIVQPDRQHYTSWYFHRAWLPLLGPNLWMLIWEMRTRCYWDKATGVKRDTFEATYLELATAIGVSDSTIKRMLHPKEEPEITYVRKFITKLKTKRRYSDKRHGTVNEKNIWKVQLDDPLTPEDEHELTRKLDLSKGHFDP